MKTSHTANTPSRISTCILLLAVSFSILSGCYTDKKIAPGVVEMIVVFKNDVPIAKASSLLFEREYIFHEGMDGSRDKKYINRTGPKYIVQVPKEKITQFNLEMKGIAQIYEVYQADWTINKN